MMYLIQRFRCRSCGRTYPLALGFHAGSHGPRDDRCHGSFEAVDNAVTVLRPAPAVDRGRIA